MVIPPLLASLLFSGGIGAAALILLAQSPLSDGEKQPGSGRGSLLLSSTTALLLAAGGLALAPRFFLAAPLALASLWGIRHGVRHRSKRMRREKVRMELPVLADSLVLNVEAGHSLFPAFIEARKVLSPSGPLAQEIGKMEGDLRLGFNYPEILSRARERLGCPEAEAFLGSISQALELGTPVARILREQSAGMRQHLLLEGEKFANTLSLKLLIPLFLFIFPASFLLILAPVIIALLESPSW